MNTDDDYDNDGNNIVPCPICLDVYCPSKENGKCPEEDRNEQNIVIEYARYKGMDVLDALNSPAVKAELKEYRNKAATPSPSRRSGQGQRDEVAYWAERAEKGQLAPSPDMRKKVIMFALEGEIRMLLDEYKATDDNSRIANVLEAVEKILHQQLQKAREEVYKEVQANAEQCYRDNGRGGFEPVKAVPLYKLFTN